MWNEPTKEELCRLPKLYETEHIPLREKIIHMHLFIGGCDWYIAETDGEELLWGFAILNGDLDMAEWGYMSFSELRDLKVSGFLEVDKDLYWDPKPASHVDLICKAQDWRCQQAGGS